MSLSFIPRNLSKSGKSRKPEHSSSKAGPPQNLTGLPVPSSPLVATQASVVTQKTTKYDDTDYANLIALSLSDYALWLDSDLRQKLRVGAQETSQEGSGYVSLHFLFEHSIVLNSLFDDMPRKGSHRSTRSEVQSVVIKAIRAHASHWLDVRLLLHSDQAVPRFGKQKEVGGGYEVRRKQLELPMRGKLEWDARTLYLENIPPGYQNHAKIIQFLSALLHEAPLFPPASTLDRDTLTLIQGITFPPHHSDKPDSRPSCKGFALVTFAHETDCEHLKNLWPWFRQQPEAVAEAELGSEQTPDPIAEVQRIAQQYHFRVMTKKRWLELKAEYLAYRQRLVDEINAYQDTQQSLRSVQSQGPQVPQISTESNSGAVQDLSGPTLSLSSPYPPNCLVFVKNVHPETTKTTLRHLFSQAFQSQGARPPRKDVESLDYVDFNKGMTTCYLRLASPKHTAMLIDYFSQSDRRIAQVSGIDETGTDISSVLSPGELIAIVMDRVNGRPEEIYWEKVPVKVKRSAVERAMKLMVGDRADTGNGDRPNAINPDNSQKRSREIDRADVVGGPPRKKRRK